MVPDFIKRMGKLDNNFIIILDISHILPANEISLFDDDNKEIDIDN